MVPTPVDRGFERMKQQPMQPLKGAAMTSLKRSLLALMTALSIQSPVAIGAPRGDAETARTGILVPYLAANRLYGYANRRGELVLPARYHDASPFRRDLAAVRVDGKWGLIDRSGIQVVEAMYDGIREEPDGTFIARIYVPGRGYSGFLNLTVRALLPPYHSGYDRCYRISPAGRVIHKWKASDGFCKAPGRQPEPPETREGPPALTVEREPAGWVVRSSAGLTVSGHPYAERSLIRLITGDFAGSDPIAFATREAADGTWCVWDGHGNRIGCGYSDVGPAPPSFIGVQDDAAAWGVIDLAGNQILPFRYTKIGYRFVDGLTTFAEGGLVFYVDTDGREYVAPELRGR